MLMKGKGKRGRKSGAASMYETIARRREGMIR